MALHAAARRGIDVVIVPFGLKGAIVSYIALHVLYLIFTAIYVVKSIGWVYAVPRFSAYRWSEVGRVS